MKVVVTGAAGRLGRDVCRALKDAAFEVLGVDRRSDAPEVKFRTIDLLDAPAVMDALGGTEAVVHLGNHPTGHGLAPQLVFNENAAMNMNVCEAAHRAGARTVIFASSVQAIAGTRASSQPERPSQLPWLPLDGTEPLLPGNAYGLSKAVGENLLRYYVEQHGLPLGVSLRLPWLRVEQEPLRKMSAEQMPRLDEGFAWLATTDAAQLVLAILRSEIRGYRVYLPAAAEPWAFGTPEELRQRYYANVPLRTPVPLASIVDRTRLEQDFHWRPVRERE